MNKAKIRVVKMWAAFNSDGTIAESGIFDNWFRIAKTKDELKSYADVRRVTVTWEEK